MSLKSKQPPPDEMKALLAQPVTVGKYEVRPWTMRRFGAVYPAVAVIVRKLVDEGLTLDNLETFIGEKVLGLLPKLAPDLPPVLAATLDIPLAEAEDLDWGTAAALTLNIFVQNLEPLKNFLALIPQLAKEIRASTPSP